MKYILFTLIIVTILLVNDSIFVNIITKPFGNYKNDYCVSKIANTLSGKWGDYVEASEYEIQNFPDYVYDKKIMLGLRYLTICNKII